MTAYKVVDSHSELNDIGNISHDVIDTHISSSAFLVTSSSLNTPPEARLLTAGTGIIIDDAGPGGNLTISTSGSTGTSLPNASSIGQILFSVDGQSFTPQTPLVSPDGWLLNNSGTLLVV